MAGTRKNQTIRPPTKQAIGKALQILLESSNSQNSTTLRKRNQSLIKVHDDRIDAYKALIESTNAALNKELQQLLHQRNMLSPFHRLPLSTCTYIMELCLEEDPDEDSARPTTLRLLASVSTGWMNTIKSTPSLWAVIDASWNPQTIQLFLRKSKSAPLKIRCVALLKSSQKLADFFATVLLHRARWQSVAIEAPIVEPLKVPARILEDIYISTPSSMMVTLTSSEPLPTIKVASSSFTWTGPIRGLRVLELCGLSQNVPTTKQVMEVIAQSPQLEIISLFKWTAPDDDEPDPGPVEVIRLPRLHTLRCVKVQSSVQYAIAQNVVAPRCQCLEFKFHGTVQLDLLQQMTNGIGNRLQSLIQKQNSAKVTFSYSDISLSSPTYVNSYPSSPLESGVHMKFDVGWERESQLPFLRWLSSQIPEQASLTTETFQAISVEALQILSAASRLICHGRSFKVIAKPIVSNNRVSWPLPHIRSLYLCWETITAKEFKELVWDRWGTCDKTHTQMERRLGITARPQG